MTVRRVTPPKLLELWQAHGANGVCGLLLGGRPSPFESELGAFVHANWQPLHDMSGVYCALAVVGLPAPDGGGGPPSSPSPEPDRPGFDYLVLATPEDLDEGHVYDLARALDIDLTALPALLVTVDPTSERSSFVLPVAEVVATSPVLRRTRATGVDALFVFFAAVFDACRAVAAVKPRRRLAALEDELRDRLGKESLGSRLVASGLIAQVIEGITGGLTDV